MRNECATVFQQIPSPTTSPHKLNQPCRGKPSQFWKCRHQWQYFFEPKKIRCRHAFESTVTSDSIIFLNLSKLIQSNYRHEWQHFGQIVTANNYRHEPQGRSTSTSASASTPPTISIFCRFLSIPVSKCVELGLRTMQLYWPVSYTHLTLPTILLV